VTGIEALQASAGSLNLLTITIVGMRLLFLAVRNRGLPELLMGLSLLLGGTLGATLEASSVMMAERLEPAQVGVMLLTGKGCALISILAQALFIQRVFRPGSLAARLAVAALVSIAVGSLLGFAAAGSFRTGEIAIGPFFVELFGRAAGSAWLFTEAFLFHRQMKKRLVLGLAEPLVTNRFLLWALGGVASLVMLLTSVPPMFIKEAGSPWLILDLVVFSASGISASICYTLAFFPPRAYANWVQVRTAR
jgi:hypothetical protein